MLKTPFLSIVIYLPRLPLFHAFIAVFFGMS